jgi:hypothetical protein
MIWAKLLPYAFVGVFFAAVGSYGTMQITKATKPEIRLECPQPVCPEFKCPEGNYIDFEKVKNFRGTLKIDQHYHITANGDSLLVKKIIEEMNVELAKIRLARCK